jgi:toxin CcdB
MTRLTPTVEFQGEDLVAMVPELAGIPTRELGKPVGDLLAVRNQLLQAIELLLTGF